MLLGDSVNFTQVFTCWFILSCFRSTWNGEKGRRQGNGSCPTMMENIGRIMMKLWLSPTSEIDGTDFDPETFMTVIQTHFQSGSQERGF